MKKFNLMGPGSKSDVIPFKLTEFKRFYTMNTGNMLFFYACERLLELADEKYGWGTAFEKINDSSSGVILPMANQIGSHFDLLNSGPAIGKIEKPMIAMGLGAQLEFTEDNFKSIPEGSIKWLKSLAGKTKGKNISVRGENTYNFLKAMGLEDSAVVLGCPSLLINESRSLGKQIKQRFCDEIKRSTLQNFISVAAGDPYHKNLELASLERSLIKIIEDNNGTYIVQNPELLIRLCSQWYENINDNEYTLIRNRWFKNKDNIEIENWFRRYAINFVSVPQWIYYFSQRSLVVGTRIHGVQTAIQAGTPAVCLYIDARTKELCETMKIPHAPASKFATGITVKDIVNILMDWDADAFDENRNKMAFKTKKFLDDNGVEYHNTSLFGRV